MIVSVAVNVPGAVGSNVTPIVHSAPGANGALQPLATMKGLSAPLRPSTNTVMPGFFLLPLGLRTLIFLGPFSPPTITVPKFSVSGLIFSLTGTGVGVAVGVEVAVAVVVDVAVAVAVAVAVRVGVAVAVRVAV